MEQNKILAEKILDLLGGKNNIISITHCATRLRPQLKDMGNVNVEAIKKLKGVTGVVSKETGIQIIIGLTVGNVYDEFLKVWNPNNQSEFLIHSDYLYYIILEIRHKHFQLLNQ